MARRRIPDPKIGGSNPSSLTSILLTIKGYWSRGMIPALGAGGREFESPIAPFFFKSQFHCVFVTSWPSG
jgi:hypothetical protein